MEYKKNENKALAKSTSTNLIKVGSLLDLSKKIISQGTLVEENYSKIKLIPYRKDGKWYLFNTIEKRILKGAYKHFKRKREYLLCLDYNNKFTLIKRDKILCHFKDFTDASRNWCPHFDITDNKNIILWYMIPTYGRKYISGWHPRIEGVLNLNGEKIELQVSKENLEFYSNYTNSDDINIKDTLWEVNEDGLYFKEQQIINGKNVEEISVGDFHYGYAFVEDIIDVDPEFGLTQVDYGFIDVYGNHYWA